MTYKIGTKAYRQKYYQEHRDEILARSDKRYKEKYDDIRAQRKTHYQDDNNYKSYILDRCKQRARRNKVECTITLDDINIPDVCPVLGFPLKRSRNGKPGFDSPSVDRINPEKGYTPDNIQVISYKANCMKNNATEDELVRFALWVLDRVG